MRHIAAMKTSIDGRVGKLKEFDTLAEAEAHVLAFSNQYPDAFVSPDPGGGFASWRVVNGGLISDPDPIVVPPVIWTARQFMGLFTDAELVAVAEAKRTNAALEIWWAKATAGEVHKDHPDTVAGLAYVVSLGLLTQARADEVLA